MKKIIAITFVSLSLNAMQQKAHDDEHRRLEREGIFLALADTHEKQKNTDKRFDTLDIRQQALETDYIGRMAAEELELERLNKELQALKEQRSNRPAMTLSIKDEHADDPRFAAMELEQKKQEGILRALQATLEANQQKSDDARQRTQTRINKLAADQNTLSSNQSWTNWVMVGGATVALSAIGTLAYYTGKQQNQINALKMRPVVTIENGQKVVTTAVDEEARSGLKALKADVAKLANQPSVNSSAATKTDELEQRIEALEKRPTVDFLVDKADVDQNKKDALARPHVLVAIHKEDEVVAFEGYVNKPGSYSDFQKSGELIVPF